MTPSTPSGRPAAAKAAALIADLHNRRGVLDGADAQKAADDLVDLVEREAVEAHRLDLAEKVRALPGGKGQAKIGVMYHEIDVIDRGDALRLIEGEKPPDTNYCGSCGKKGHYAGDRKHSCNGPDERPASMREVHHADPE